MREPHGHQPRLPRVRRAHGDFRLAAGQIELACAHYDVQLDIRVFIPECRKVRRDPVRRELGHEREPHAARDPPGGFACASTDGHRRAFHGLRARDDGLADRRQQVAARGTVEERRPELRLERGDAPADGAVLDAQLPCGDGEASRTRNRKEHAEVVPVHACALLHTRSCVNC